MIAVGEMAKRAVIFVDEKVGREKKRVSHDTMAT
jgi:hypothetical protein